MPQHYRILQTVSSPYFKREEASPRACTAIFHQTALHIILPITSNSFRCDIRSFTLWFMCKVSTMVDVLSNPIVLLLLIWMFYFVQIMDDRWETEVIEYGAINITGFRIVDSSRRYVKDFLEGWRKLDPITSQGAGRDSISVGLLAFCQWLLCWHMSTNTNRVSCHTLILIFSRTPTRKLQNRIHCLRVNVSAGTICLFFIKDWAS